MNIRPAIKELNDEDLKLMLRVILVGGNPKDKSDRAFAREVVEEMHRRGLDKEPR